VLWVPLVVRLPFSVEPPVRVVSQVRNLDVAPTLLDLVGVEAPEAFEGRSLVGLMTGEAAEPDRPSFAALGVPLFPDASVQMSISTGSWTYARNATAPPDDPDAYEAKAVAPGVELLFDRRIDPGENVNLIGREPGEARRMRAQLDDHLATAGPGVVEPGVRIDPGIAGRLRAMGYLR